ncbi:hypothetical protein NSTCB13_05916 [Nostoc sp. DSM 114160]|jgi:hypothetical protein
MTLHVPSASNLACGNLMILNLSHYSGFLPDTQKEMSYETRTL